MKTWQKTHSPHSFQRTTYPKLFTDHMKVFEKDKPYCKQVMVVWALLQNEWCIGFMSILQIGFWHVICLKKIYEKRGIVCTTPNGDGSDWRCIHCLQAHWEYQSLIWISWNYFFKCIKLSLCTIFLKIKCWLNIDRLLTKSWPEHTFTQSISTLNLTCLKYFYGIVKYIHSWKFP